MMKSVGDLGAGLPVDNHVKNLIVVVNIGIHIDPCRCQIGIPAARGFGGTDKVDSQEFTA